jgi:hypothetical protein
LELKRLDPTEQRSAFTCGDPDLDEFYLKDSIQSAQELLAVTYVLLDDSGSVIAYLAWQTTQSSGSRRRDRHGSA